MFILIESAEILLIFHHKFLLLLFLHRHIILHRRILKSINHQPIHSPVTQLIDESEYKAVHDGNGQKRSLGRELHQNAGRQQNE